MFDVKLSSDFIEVNKLVGSLDLTSITFVGVGEAGIDGVGDFLSSLKLFLLLGATDACCDSEVANNAVPPLKKKVKRVGECEGNGIICVFVSVYKFSKVKYKPDFAPLLEPDVVGRLVILVGR